MHSIYEKLPQAEPDELFAPEVGDWAKQKNLKLWNYLGIFTTGMKNEHDARLYVDLFAGAGKNRVRGTGEWLLGSPLLALAVRDPFDRLVFCEKDPLKAQVLRERALKIRPSNVHVLNIDANEDISAVASLVLDGRILTFCFVDPYDIGFNFSRLEQLTQNRLMDVLILLAVQMDAVRNLEIYRKEDNQKISRLLGRDDWRDEWSVAEKSGVQFGTWLRNAFTGSMVRIGYVRPKDTDFQIVRVGDSKVGLYYLGFYSKNEVGYKFWREAIKYSTEQRSLFGDV